MGTDYLQLLDRRSAEIIIRADDLDLAVLVDLRTTVGRPSIWRQYWDAEQQAFVEFNSTVTAAERLKTLVKNGSTIGEIKEELLRKLCIGDWLHVDYWGCWGELFSCSDPAGAITWEEFTAPLHADSQRSELKPGASGCYLFTDDNIHTILNSLELHRHELQIMSGAQIERLRSWRAFCRKHTEFCILYQIDF